MRTTADTTTNVRLTAQLQRALGELLREALQRGFHGKAELEVAVQDGTIQCIRRRVERMER